MNQIEQILTSKEKPKAKILALVELVKNKELSISDLVEYFNSCPKAQKGHIIESIEYVTQENPELAEPYIDFVIENLAFEAPRVKWEAARIIGNLAPQYANKLDTAIKKLLVNTADNGTVVRWSTAFALTEIAKHNEKKRAELEEEFQKILKREENNGVKNVYLKFKKSKVKS